MTRHWYFSTPRATGLITTQDNTIVDIPPIWAKFHDQHIKALADWLRSNSTLEAWEYRSGPLGQHALNCATRATEYPDGVTYTLQERQVLRGRGAKELEDIHNIKFVFDGVVVK